MMMKDIELEFLKDRWLELDLKSEVEEMTQEQFDKFRDKVNDLICEIKKKKEAFGDE